MEIYKLFVWQLNECFSALSGFYEAIFESEKCLSSPLRIYKYIKKNRNPKLFLLSSSTIINKYHFLKIWLVFYQFVQFMQFRLYFKFESIVEQTFCYQLSPGWTDSCRSMICAYAFISSPRQMAID